MPRSPIAAGVLLAFGAAIAFGSTIPLVHHFGAHVGPFTTASALYFGASLIAVLWRSPPGTEPPVRREHWARIALVAVAGAVVAPAALAWGLQHSDATSASLLLNFEAIFTVLLARIFFGERIGARVWVASLLVLLGGSALVVGNGALSLPAATGLLAVLLATTAWAIDNTLTRPLANLDPMGVIARKAILGSAFAVLLAAVFREPLPSPSSVAILLACGATGYGLSLRLYLLAQRKVGAARTGSVFAVAPFIGAVLGWLTGEGQVTAAAVFAGVLFAIAVVLHLTEKHAHRHRHLKTTHEHAHRHDDAHHNHVHDFVVVGSHSHVHEHSALTHEHEHAPDVHHEHQH
jgi:drug/metabolite transporter (DMT)-like permease